MESGTFCLALVRQVVRSCSHILQDYTDISLLESFCLTYSKEDKGFLMYEFSSIIWIYGKLQVKPKTFRDNRTPNDINQG